MTKRGAYESDGIQHRREEHTINCRRIQKNGAGEKIRGKEIKGEIKAKINSVRQSKARSQSESNDTPSRVHDDNGG